MFFLKFPALLEYSMEFVKEAYATSTSMASGALGWFPRGIQGLLQDAFAKVLSVREEVRSTSRCCRRPFASRQLNSTSFQREAKFHETAKGSEVIVHQASHSYSTALFSCVSLVCQSGLGSSGSVPGVRVVVGFFRGPVGKCVVAHR